MTEPPLIILGYSEAAMYLRRPENRWPTAIISIHGRRDFGIEAETQHRLDLKFDDVEVPLPTDPSAVWRAMSRKRWAEQNGLIEVPPAATDAIAIIDFAEMIRLTSGPLLCHCGAGMSRAPAAALICLSVWRGPGSEVDCIADISSLRRGAVPHVGLTRFADDLLGRGGKLCGALATANQ